MKIIAFVRRPGETVTMPPRIEAIPDSAITVPNRPLFLPDFSAEWSGNVCPAYRISRLGKEIGRRFASRYYDAVTLALRIHPVDIVPCGICSVFDSCVTLGEWLPLQEGNLEVGYAGLTLSLTPEEIDIDGAIEAISHYCTLKTGDIVMPCVLPVTFPLIPDHPLTATLGASTFTVKIK